MTRTTVRNCAWCSKEFTSEYRSHGKDHRKGWTLCCSSSCTRQNTAAEKRKQKESA